MEIKLEQVKELRRLTGAGINSIKEALEFSKGDIDKSVLFLREKGLAKASKRSDKQATNGFIAHYIHGEGSLGVLVEVNSETDFASRNEKFRELAFALAVHIAAAAPEYIRIEDIPEDILKKEIELAKKSIKGDIPKEIAEKIVNGKLQKFYEETVLMEQSYVKDDSKKIKDLINDAVSAIGEKIEVSKFCRIKINTPSSTCGV